MFTENEISQIVRWQLVSLLWSCVDSSEDAMHENFDEYYDADDATPELVAKLTEELQILGSGEMSCEMHDALTAYREMYPNDYSSRFGHDLALTRNHHGAGFWDRGLGEAGDTLTDWAHSLGELNVYHGDESIHSKWHGMFHAE